MELDGLTEDACVKAFGKPGPDAYYEPESGYDGMSWNFVKDDGAIVSLYFRYGRPRIGGSMTMDGIFLVEFLNKKYGWNVKHEFIDQNSYEARMRAHAAIDNWVNS